MVNQRLGPPPMNPLTRILAGLFGLLALVGAFFFGFLILAVAVAVGIAAWIALRVRFWWFGRRRDTAAPAPGDGAGDAGRKEKDSSVIEGEYKVVSRRDD